MKRQWSAWRRLQVEESSIVLSLYVCIHMVFYKENKIKITKICQAFRRFWFQIHSENDNHNNSNYNYSYTTTSITTMFCYFLMSFLLRFCSFWDRVFSGQGIQRQTWAERHQCHQWKLLLFRKTPWSEGWGWLQTNRYKHL